MPARRNFLQKKISVSRNCGIFIILGVSAKKNFGFLAEKFGSVVNLEIYVPGWTFWTKKLIGVKAIFYRFRNSSTRSSDFHWDTSGGIVKASTYLSSGTFCGSVKVFSKTQFIFFGIPAKLIRPTADVFFGRIVKSKIWESRRIFRGKIFFLRKVFSTLLDLLWKKICRIFNPAFYVFRGISRVKFKFFHPLLLWARKKLLLINFFTHGHRNGSLRAQRKSLKKKMFHSQKLQFLYHFRTFSKSLWRFGRKKMPRLSKLLFMCPVELMSRFAVEIMFFHHFITLSGKNYFWLNFSSTVAKTAFYVPKKKFWRKKWLLRRNCNFCITFGVSAEKFGFSA